jgi:polyhydroxyalkanoate synthase
LINKFYILDMQPKNSMIRYLVGQGFTVFVISWKNPDASMDDIDIEDYMDLGPIEASDVAREITGSPTVNAMGYCIGGTLHRRHRNSCLAYCASCRTDVHRQVHQGAKAGSV